MCAAYSSWRCHPEWGANCTHTPDFINTMESRWVPFLRQSRPRISLGYFCGRGTLSSLLGRCLRAFFLSYFLSCFLLFLSFQCALRRPVEVAVLVARFENRLGRRAPNWRAEGKEQQQTCGRTHDKGTSVIIYYAVYPRGLLFISLFLWDLFLSVLFLFSQICDGLSVLYVVWLLTYFFHMLTPCFIFLP